MVLKAVPIFFLLLSLFAHADDSNLFAVEEPSLIDEDEDFLASKIVEKHNFLEDSGPPSAAPVVAVPLMAAAPAQASVETTLTPPVAAPAPPPAALASAGSAPTSAGSAPAAAPASVGGGVGPPIQAEVQAEITEGENEALKSVEKALKLAEGEGYRMGKAAAEGRKLERNSKAYSIKVVFLLAMIFFFSSI